MYILKPKKSTTAKKYIVSSKKKISTKKNTQVLKKNKYAEKGKKVTVKKYTIAKNKNVLVKIKKAPEKYVVEDDDTNILDDILEPATKRSKRVVGGKKLMLKCLCCFIRQCLLSFKGKCPKMEICIP